MFLFDLLFGKADKPAASASGRQAASPAPHAVAPAAGSGSAAPGTGILFHPELIAKFRQDHQHLLKLFQATKAAADIGAVAEAAGHLDEFRAALQDHLLTENVRLYVYLEHALASDATSHALIHGFRHEMDEIGKVVVGFLGKYHDLAQRPDLAPGFAAELDIVGKVLAKRIQREEETLYPLYAPV